jgi:hypothetical protein
MYLQPKEGLEAETFNEMQQVMDWQTKSAKKLGVSLEDFTSAAVMSKEAALEDMVEEVSDRLGVDSGNLLSTVFMFQDRTQRAADQAGLQHEEFLGALFGVLSFALCSMPARHVPSFACIRRSVECLLVMIDVCVCYFIG